MAILAKNPNTFVIYVAILKVLELVLYFFLPLVLAVLQQNKVTIEIFSEYAGYITVFFSDLAMKLLKNTIINEHVIRLIESKKSLYGFFHSQA